MGVCLCKAVRSLKYRVPGSCTPFVPHVHFVDRPCSNTFFASSVQEGQTQCLSPRRAFLRGILSTNSGAGQPQSSPGLALEGRIVVAHDLDATPYALSPGRVVWIPKQAFNSVPWLQRKYGLPLRRFIPDSDTSLPYSRGVLTQPQSHPGCPRPGSPLPLFL